MLQEIGQLKDQTSPTTTINRRVNKPKKKFHLLMMNSNAVCI
jgi:hypothetical protein